MSNRDFSFRVKHYRFHENKITTSRVPLKNHEPVIVSVPEPVIVPAPKPVVVPVPEPVIVPVPEDNVRSLQINKIKKDLRDKLKNKK